MPGDPVERLLRKPLQESGQPLAAQLGPMRLSDHLNVSERKIPIVRAEIEVIQSQGLLKPGGIRCPGHGHQHRVVVPHVVSPDKARGIGQSRGVIRIRRSEHEQGRRQCSARDHDDIRSIANALLAANDLDPADSPAAVVRGEFVHVTVGHQGQVRVRMQRRIHANDLRIGLAIGQTGIAVEGVAADTGRMREREPILLIQQDAHGEMEGRVTFTFETVEELLNARFVRQGRIRIPLARGRLGGILPAQSMHVIELLGGLIIRLKRVVLERPRRRDAVRMPDLIEVLLAQPQQHRPIHLAVAAHKIVQARMKRLAVRAVPGFHRLIAGIDENRFGVPVFALARQVVTALQQQYSLSGLCQAPRHRPAAGT